jgi:hypothetical protein
MASSGPLGCPITSASGSHVVALPDGGASAAQELQLSGTVATVGLFNGCAIIRSKVIGNSGGGARLGRRAEVTRMGRGSRGRRHRAAGGIIRNVVAPSFFRVGPGLIRTFGSSGPCGERPDRDTWHGSGLATVGVTTRRFTGHSHTVALASVS